MASAATTTVASLRAARTGPLAALCAAMERIAPLRLSESWDNTGLLLDSSSPATSGAASGSGDGATFRVFVTNDLTEKVAEEALVKRAQVIVTYHPTPFRGMKKITRSSPAGRIVMSLLSNGVAVYSPHTALDSAAGGVNDWLAGGLGEGVVEPLVPHPEIEGAGTGRIIRFTVEMSLADVVAAAKKHLSLPHVRVAAAMHHASLATERATAEAVTAAATGMSVSSVAVCAGSGISVLRGVEADVYLTGEMSHHDVLAANADGVNVILTDHTNTERGYLPVLRDRLLADPEFLAGVGGEVDVVVTSLDHDPLVVV